MKALKIIVTGVVSIALICGAGYLYASSGIKSKPGFAKISTPSIDAQRALLSVNVGPGGVKPVRWLVEKMADNASDVDQVQARMLKKTLHELQGVQLRVYDSSNNQRVFDSAMAEAAASLKDKNWQTLMTVRDKEEQIMVLQYVQENQIAGLSIMASTPDRALFLNLIGPFDVEAISATAEELRKL